MDKVKAQDIASKLIGLGYAVQIKKTIINNDENYTIRIDNAGIQASVVANFAAVNTLSATINGVELS